MAKLSMKSLQAEIDAFQKENESDILHTYKIGGESGYYTLEKYSKDGSKKWSDVSTSPTFTKRKGVSAGSLNACRFAWLISQWR